MIGNDRRRDKLCTPALHNTCKEGLFRVICNIWPKTIYDASEVIICAADDLGLRHPRLEGSKDLGK